MRHVWKARLLDCKDDCVIKFVQNDSKEVALLAELSVMYPDLQVVPVLFSVPLLHLGVVAVGMPCLQTLRELLNGPDDITSWAPVVVPQLLQVLSLYGARFLAL